MTNIQQQELFNVSSTYNVFFWRCAQLLKQGLLSFQDFILECKRRNDKNDKYCFYALLKDHGQQQNFFKQLADHQCISEYEFQVLAENITHFSELYYLKKNFPLIECLFRSSVKIEKFMQILKKHDLLYQALKTEYSFQHKDIQTLDLFKDLHTLNVLTPTNAQFILSSIQTNYELRMFVQSYLFAYAAYNFLLTQSLVGKYNEIIAEENNLSTFWSTDPKPRNFDSLVRHIAEAYDFPMMLKHAYLLNISLHTYTFDEQQQLKHLLLTNAYSRERLLYIMLNNCQHLFRNFDDLLLYLSKPNSFDLLNI